MELESLRLLEVYCWNNLFVHAGVTEGISRVLTPLMWKSRLVVTGRFKPAEMATAELVSPLQDGTFYTAHCIV